MKNIEKAKQMNKDQFTRLAAYYASKKHNHYCRGGHLPVCDVRRIQAMQDLTKERFPELNHLFKK